MILHQGNGDDQLVATIAPLKILFWWSLGVSIVVRRVAIVRASSPCSTPWSGLGLGVSWRRPIPFPGFGFSAGPACGSPGPRTRVDLEWRDRASLIARPALPRGPGGEQSDGHDQRGDLAVPAGCPV